MINLDPRVNAYRPDVADVRLRSRVVSARYVAGEPRQVMSTVVAVKALPDAGSPQTTQALLGEQVVVFDEQSGWSFVQLTGDGYVGYVRTESLAASSSGASLTVRVPVAFEYAEPDIKSHTLRWLPMGARFEGETAGDFVQIAGGGYVARQCASGQAPEFVAVAEQFAGAPYLWGGKTHAGLDCSGLIQIALQAAGFNAPRDSDMQEAQLGAPVPAAGWNGLRRGDLVFWRGHVGVMLDGQQVLHANAHHMAVTSEPLAAAAARAGAKNSPITSVRRLRGGSASSG